MIVKKKTTVELLNESEKASLPSGYVLDLQKFEKILNDKNCPV